MIVDNIKSFNNGWMIGDFNPSLLKTPFFEIAHHFYVRGFKGRPHIHKIATEYNYIISGSLIASQQKLTTGDIFIYQPNDVSDVIFLEDTNLIVIKIPSITTDKYEVDI